MGVVFVSHTSVLIWHSVLTIVGHLEFLPRLRLPDCMTVFTVFWQYLFQIPAEMVKLQLSKKKTKLKTLSTGNSSPVLPWVLPTQGCGLWLCVSQRNTCVSSSLLLTGQWVLVVCCRSRSPHWHKLITMTYNQTLPLLKPFGPGEIHSPLYQTGIASRTRTP